MTTTTIDLTWQANAEADIAGYDVFRRIDGTFVKLNQALLTSPSYVDSSAPIGEESAYRVVAVDIVGNASDAATINATRWIGLRGATTASNKVESSLTVRRPEGVQQGDVMIATISVLDAPILSAPAGWGVVRDQADGTVMRQVTYVKVVGASEPATYSWTFPARYAAVGTIAAYVNVDVTSPIDAANAQTNASSMSITAPALDVTTVNAVLVGSFGIATNACDSAPRGMDDRGQAMTGGQKKMALEVSDMVLSATGTTTPMVAIASKAARSIGTVVALRPLGSEPPVDTQAPSVPTNLRAASVMPQQVDLLWDPSTDNVAVDSYVVLRDGVMIGTSAAASFTDDGVAPETSYAYTVIAVDAAGNASAQSAALSVTTPALPGTLPIEFRGVSTGKSTTSTLNIARPNASVPGDILIASIDVRATSTITAPTGWNMIRTDQAGSAMTKITYWRLVTATDPASYTWSFGAPQASVGIVAAYSGVDATNPVAGSLAVSYTTNVTQLRAPSVAATEGQFLLTLFGSAGNGTIQQPSGTQERAEVVANGTLKVVGELADRAVVTSGETGEQVAGVSKAAPGIAVTVVLRPPAV